MFGVGNAMWFRVRTWHKVSGKKEEACWEAGLEKMAVELEELPGPAGTCRDLPRHLDS